VVIPVGIISIDPVREKVDLRSFIVVTDIPGLVVFECSYVTDQHKSRFMMDM